MSRASFERKLRESDQEEPARLPELTLVSAREPSQGIKKNLRPITRGS
jgi:hypothetical protein